MDARSAIDRSSRTRISTRPFGITNSINGNFAATHEHSKIRQNDWMAELSHPKVSTIDGWCAVCVSAGRRFARWIESHTNRPKINESPMRRRWLEIELLGNRLRALEEQYPEKLLFKLWFFTSIVYATNQYLSVCLIARRTRQAVNFPLFIIRRTLVRRAKVLSAYFTPMTI